MTRSTAHEIGKWVAVCVLAVLGAVVACVAKGDYAFISVLFLGSAVLLGLYSMGTSDFALSDVGMEWKITKDEDGDICGSYERREK